ncbi:BadM/Rrf2 family transcriptional regulator [Mucilaginibacter gracilis]|uniref:BadM/Rrf2 family transcriptional regulator n=1 Tax=Mucilaginibacter gracilis TaxID=423350 RepID=A0A495IWL9_9SPHI|nr:Rrf2 family transcriptional regulator [Mucilaginibacter gracilis]RKR80424.1 BadM/Rrf2 family transcriptional regulator [Mucilaginibacter gracilis]
MLSKKTKYAIKALILLGRNRDQPPMQIKQIAEMETIPKKFLEQILLELRNNGFVYSKKGAGGGYALNKEPSQIILVDIMRITDGPIAMVPCASLNYYHRCEECINEATCGIRSKFIELRDVTVKVLSETSIADVMEREDLMLKSE